MTTLGRSCVVFSFQRSAARPARGERKFPALPSLPTLFELARSGASRGVGISRSSSLEQPSRPTAIVSGCVHGLTGNRNRMPEKARGVSSDSSRYLPL